MRANKFSLYRRYLIIAALPALLVSIIIVFQTLSSSHAGFQAYPLLQKITFRDNISLIWNLAWKPDSDEILVGEHMATYLLDLSTNEIRRLRDEVGTSNYVAWSPDSHRIAGASNIVWIGDVASGEINAMSGEPLDFRYFNSISWSPDGEFVAAMYVQPRPTTNTIQIWNTNTHESVTLNHQLLGNPMDFAWSPTDKLIAVSFDDSSIVQVVEFNNPNISNNLQAHTETITSIAWSRSGDLLATADVTGRIAIWDSSTWQTTTTLVQPNGGISSIKWSDTDQYLATAGDNGVTIWNLELRQSSVVQREPSQDVEWSVPSDRIASVIGDEIAIWDVSRFVN